MNDKKDKKKKEWKSKFKTELYEYLTKQYTLVITEDEILKMAREKGWKGMGTESDPIIIKSIDDDFKQEFAFFNIELHLVCEDCEFPSRIELHFCSNMKFINCSIHLIALHKCFNNYFKKNIIKEIIMDPSAIQNRFENNNLSAEEINKINKVNEIFKIFQDLKNKITKFFPLICVAFILFVGYMCFILFQGNIDNIFDLIIKLVLLISIILIIIGLPTLYIFLLRSKDYEPNIIIENESKLKNKKEINV